MALKPRAGHYEEFISKLPDETELASLLQALESKRELNAEEEAALQRAHATFNFYVHVASKRHAFRVQFHPIMASMVAAMRAEQRAMRRIKKKV